MRFSVELHLADKFFLWYYSGSDNFPLVHFCIFLFFIYCFFCVSFIYSFICILASYYMVIINLNSEWKLGYQKEVNKFSMLKIKKFENKNFLAISKYDTIFYVLLDRVQNEMTPLDEDQYNVQKDISR